MRVILLAAAAALCAGAALAQNAICTNCQPVKVATCGGFLEGINIGPDGRIWVVDISGDRILTVEDGQCVEQARAGGRPNGAKFDAQGRLVVADAGGLLRYDPADGSLTVLADSFDGEPLVELNDLAIDANGGIYFTAPSGTNLANPRGLVLYLAPGASDPVLVGGGFAYPNGVTLPPGGVNVLVSEFAAKRILALPTQEAGGFRTTYVHAFTEAGIGPDGMTIGPNGTLYAALFGAGGVMVFDAQGWRLGVISLPEGAGTFTTNVAVADGVLYISEATLGEIWSVNLND